ncbi:MAG TPA: glycosyltransferase family 1 protein [Phycisphaerales bacterium]|nr:glycosyltransferase family 1 protein [Phycisphaerales bacterium]
MDVSVWIARRYDSRFSLLGAMADQLAQAFAERGFDVPDGLPDGSKPGLYIFFNMPPAIEALPAAVRRPGARVAAIQILVDHPLALDAGVMDQTAKLPNFRLALPSLDGLHLLRLRWPTLRHGHMPHGIPVSAVINESECSPEAFANRPHDVILAGSIHTEQEVRDIRWSLPPQTHPWIDEMVELMAAEPAMPYEQALDLVCGSRGVITGNWPMAAALWRAVTAALNRERRINLAKSLQGLDVAIFGNDAWKEICTGSITHAGNITYSTISESLAKGRICLAWGPTQFPHTFSERLLLSMASGCASVAEERYMIRQHFTTHGDAAQLATFDPRNPSAARDRIESLLADPDRASKLASNGRAEVLEHHLWRNRVDLLAALGAEALGSVMKPQPA